MNTPRVLLIPLMLAIGFDAAAANYYVATNGNNANAGTSPAAPFLTIRRGAQAVNPGDTVFVSAGRYDEVVDITRAGTAAARIRYVGSNAITSGLNIRLPYNTFEGFTLDGRTLGNFGGAVYIYEAADFTWIFNCRIQNLTNKFGVQFAFPSSIVPTNGQLSCIVSNCVLDNVRYVNFMIYGNGHIFTKNTIMNSAGEGDAFRPWGANHIMSDNLITNLTGTDGGHADVVQTFGLICQNMTFERNLVIGTSAQICQFEMNPSGGYNYTNGFMTNFVFRNNVFANLDYAANVDMDGTKWYNNVFYRVNTLNGGHVFALGGEKGSAFGTEIKNNAFIECGSGGPSVGWYQLPGSIAGITNFTVSADYNFVCGTNFSAKQAAPPDSGSRWGSQGQEVHGINGGNPRFVNLAALDFRLASNSPLVDAGTTIAGFNDDIVGSIRPSGPAWDIGAYELRFVDAANLRTALVGNRVELRWETGTLQSTTNLTSSSSWNNVTSGVSPLLVDPTNRFRFYRVRMP